MSRIFVAGVGFDAITLKSACQRVNDFLSKPVQQEQKFLLVTPNPEMLLAASRDPQFRKVLNSAALAVPDGFGILWASYFLTYPQRSFLTLLKSLVIALVRPQRMLCRLPERVTGTDLLPKILQIAAAKKQKVFLLGAAPGIAEKVKKHFETQISGLQITGTFAGSPAPNMTAAIRRKIDTSKAELLFVAFGAPRQELWLSRELPKFKTVRFAAGVGGALDFYAGQQTRAPQFLRNRGLEWIWRLAREPKRVGRIWNATFRFVKLVWRSTRPQGSFRS